MMIKLLTETLTQLKVVKVQVHSFSIRKQVNLFDSETTVDLSFNGYKHTADYHKYLDKLYDRCKSNLEEQLKEIQSDSVELKRALDLFRFEVREFKNRNFPKDNEQVLFNRVEFIKTSQRGNFDDLGLKKKF
jgi:DNA repair ATPase RecN